MTVDVKICGLRTAATLDAALAAGADYVGLVFYEPSPRNVTISEAAPLAEQARGRSKIVALFVDPDDALLDSVMINVRPDIVQLHGSESPARITDIRKRTTALIMKAVKVATSTDVLSAAQYAGLADLILFDAKPPKLADSDNDTSLPGGNGERFDWRLLDAHDPAQPWMLSGGLDAQNVADAIRQTGATAVDVSSGVERARGEKDVAMIKAFVTAAKSAKISGDADTRPTDPGARNHVEA